MTRPTTRRLLGIIVSLSLLAGFASHAVAVDGGSYTTLANQKRASVGLKPVSWSAPVDQVAVERANQMAARDDFSHDLPYVAQRLKALGVCFTTYGEIIAWEQNYPSYDPARTIEQWWKSPGHHAIMVGDYHVAGGSHSKSTDTGKLYSAMIFVKLCAASTPAAPSPSGFEDVSGSIFAADIAWLVNNDVTSGCTPSRFCPRSPVTREQMASFLKRGMDLAYSPNDFFRDDSTSVHQDDINRVAAATIAAGCADLRYCPRGNVTRGQMASFLARALDLPAATRDYFRDDNGTMHEGSINRLAQAGVTGGCASGRFCPLSTVTREQMAGFLHRALGD